MIHVKSVSVPLPKRGDIAVTPLRRTTRLGIGTSIAESRVIIRAVRRLAISVLLATACSAPAPTADGGADAPAPLDAGLELPVLTVGDGMPPDWSCLGVATTPPRGDTTSWTLRMTDFASGAPAVGVCAHVYEQDAPLAPDETCAPGDPRVASDGTLVLDVPATGLFRLRTFAQAGLSALDSFVDVLFFDHLGPATGSGGLTLSEATLNEVARQSGRARDASAGAVGVAARDCMLRGLAGAEVRLARADGTPIALGGDGAVRMYRPAQTSSFEATQPWTSGDGVALFENVPITTPGEPIFVEVWGRRTPEGTPEIVGCTSVRLVAGAVSAAALLVPLRVDGPACPGLR